MSIDHDGSQIVKLLRPYHITLLELAAADANGVLGIDASFELDAPEVQDVLDLLATKVRSVAETTREDIRRLTGQAAEHGWSPAHLADEIRYLGEIASKSRAELIALTESATAYEAGSHLRWSESGMVSGSEWLLGPSPCPDCQELGGKVVPLGEEFADGVLYPPRHPRCTCATSAVLSE
jgi:hypothetical protein